MKHDDPPCKRCGHPRSHHNSHGHDSGGCTTCERYNCLDYVHDHGAASPPFQPEAITDEEAELIRRMTPEEQAYLCGRLVEREGPDTPEDRAALFEQMRRVISERRYGTPFSVGEARAVLRAWPRPKEASRYVHDLIAWLCDEIDRLTSTERDFDAALAELPDDPPGGYTFPEAIRAMRSRINDLENALKFYADNKNYEAKRDESSPVFADYGVIARDLLHNPRKQ
jgi:hypothetical protein